MNKVTILHPEEIEEKYRERAEEILDTWERAGGIPEELIELIAEGLQCVYNISKEIIVKKNNEEDERKYNTEENTCVIVDH